MPASETRGRKLRPGARPFKDQLAEMPLAYKKCRTFMHRWDDDLAKGARVLRMDDRTITVVIRCDRCGATKPVEIVRKGRNRGERHSKGGYVYPDDYQFDFPLFRAERQAIYADVAESFAQQAIDLELRGLIETTNSA